MIGTFTGLAQQRLFGQIHDHPLRAGGDDRGRVGDEDFARSGERLEKPLDRQFAGLDVLDDLLHSTPL